VERDNGFVLDIRARVLEFEVVLLMIGMPNALLCAEAVAMMILGKDPPEYFPKGYLLSQERMQAALADAERAGKGEEVKRVKL
jgi:hypothetical protein